MCLIMEMSMSHDGHPEKEPAQLVEPQTESEVRAALAESMARLEEMQAMAHVGLWSWDAGSGAFQMSQELHRIHGVTPADFDGTLDAFLDFVQVDHRDPVTDDPRRGFATRERYDDVYSSARPASYVRWIDSL